MSENLSTPTPIDLAGIQAKINALSELTDTHLEGAMKELKVALRDNPAACNLMLPEDIGMLVGYIIRLENKVIVEAEAKPAKAKKMSKSIQSLEAMGISEDEM